MHHSDIDLNELIGSHVIRTHVIEFCFNSRTAKINHTFFLWQTLALDFTSSILYI